MRIILDGDIIAYRCGAVTEGLDVNLAKWQTNELVKRILAETNATDWQIWLSGDNNFRYKLYSDYKANRRNMVRPEHLESIREHLVVDSGARITDGYEADDAMGIDSTLNPTSIISSIDKDLLQLPGLHYNFVKREFKEVNEFDGWRNFFSQLLTGDAADNLPGCPNIGKVKAEAALYPCTTRREMYDVCCALYQRAYLKEPNTWQTHLNLQAQLLYIWRKDNDTFVPPEMDEKPSSSTLSETTSSVPTAMEKTPIIPSVGD